MAVHTMVGILHCAFPFGKIVKVYHTAAECHNGETVAVGNPTLGTAFIGFADGLHHTVHEEIPVIFGRTNLYAVMIEGFAFCKGDGANAAHMGDGRMGMGRVEEDFQRIDLGITFCNTLPKLIKDMRAAVDHIPGYKYGAVPFRFQHHRRYRQWVKDTAGNAHMELSGHIDRLRG